MAKWDVKTLARAVLTMLVASCSPASSGDDVVDSTVDTAPMAREFTLQCTPSTVEATFPDGRKNRTVYWTATFDPPYEWDRVHARVCNSDSSTIQGGCPSGTTSCVGTAPSTPRCEVRDISIVEYDGPARILCGVTYDYLDAAGNMTGHAGQHWMQATVRIE